MPSRILREDYRHSDSLTKCSIDSEDRYPRFLLCADDHGCFEIDIEEIRGFLFPKRLKQISIEIIKRHLTEYNQNGMLFMWRQNGKTYGFFVRWFEHQSIREANRHKRHTPEPPKEELAKYMKQFELPSSVIDCHGMTPTPFPNPNPNLIKKITETVIDKILKPMNPKKEHLLIVRDAWSRMGIPDFNWGHIERLQRDFAITPEQMVKLIEKQGEYLKKKGKQDRRALWENMCKSPAKYL